MSRTKSNKMFMLFASAALAGTLAVTMSGCSAPEEPANEANGNEATSTISEEPDKASSEAERTAEEELANPLPARDFRLRMVCL